MIFHVLPGDAVAEKFKDAKISGEVIVCRECLVEGPVQADSLDDFWAEREKFINENYGGASYNEKVVDQFARLRHTAAGDEVNLWFEYELFCSVNLWFTLCLLQGSKASVYRVEPFVSNYADRWKGFSELDASALPACLERRSVVTDADVELGARLWKAFRSNDKESLLDLSVTQTHAFPYLEEVCRAAVEMDTRPRELLKKLKADTDDFDAIFARFSSELGIYGFGDSQVKRLLDAV